LRNQRPDTVTLNDVAAAAQVSRATASRVLTGDQRVGPMYRTAVLAAAEQLGYVANRAARSLRTRRSGSIGVVLAEPSAVVFGNPFFGQLLSGIAQQLNERDLQLTLFLPQNERDEQRLASYLASGHVDGVLLTFYQDRDPLYDRLAQNGIPVVVNARPLQISSASYVDADNEGGAVLAVEHLLEVGCRTIATVAGPLGTSAGAERLAGYRRALERAGLAADETLIRVGDFTTPSGRDQTASLITDNPGIDGLFIAGELMAYGALEALHRLGRQIPEDVAMVSFDDLPGAATTDPPLTSISQPIEQMGREMTRLLLAQLDDNDRIPRQVILGTHLVIRESSRRTRSPAVSSSESPLVQPPAPDLAREADPRSADTTTRPPRQ
jgi:DNA-binding LacI/PurR family transcriptional regulator